MLDDMARIWSGEARGFAGSRGVDPFRRGAEQVRQAWAAHGRTGTPWLMALPYFALGPRARANAAAFLGDHYAVEGPAAPLISAALTDPHAIRAAVAAYERAGCGELLLFPCSADPEQVRLLAEAIVH